MSEVSFNVKKAREFFGDKRVQIALTAVLLLTIIVLGTWIRVQNLDLLKDQTTGEYIPLALDPFYFLRVAETMISEGGLPAVDNMRYPSAGVGFNDEILPNIIVYMHKASNIFGDYSLQHIDIIQPVIFFILGMFAFFFLIYYLTGSKTIAILSSAILVIIPSYLYRTIAGFADHEAIGMFAFFLTLLVFTLSLKSSKNREGYVKTILWSLGVSLATGFTIASFGGVATFLFLIIPLSFLVMWIVDSKEKNNDNLMRHLIFYGVWIFFSIISATIMGREFFGTFNRYLLSGQQIFGLIVLGFMAADFSLLNFLKKRKISWIKEKYRILYSLIGLIILGILLLVVSGENIISLASNMIDKFLHPFGTGRAGLTVAENRQPFLSEWISQTGKWMFWLFFAGIIFLGIEISKGIKQHKNKLLFVGSWIILILGIMFSRLSSDSLFNGTSFISQFFYIGSILLFLAISLYVYFRDEIKIKKEHVIIFSWLVITIIAARSAVRVFFIITPLAVFMMAFATERIFNYTLRTKDELMKVFMYILSAAVIFILITSSMGFYQATLYQAQNTGPSANEQWQKAMSWVRENTPEDSIFTHWWDYGYWVQYLGERATIADGGHAVSYWHHLIGRYVLTTPEPETAYSFMKTHNSSYLLIDPSDFGKYGAYSKIGSDEGGNDRYSNIPVMMQSRKEPSGNDTETIIYQGGTIVDGDITYGENGDIFLPRGKAYIGGIILKRDKSKSVQFDQPLAAYIYNNQQVSIPLRYLYYNNQLIDFGGGLNATAVITPRVTQNGQQFDINNVGSVIYLSPKVTEGAYAQLYLLHDAFENYEGFELAHAQDDSLAQFMNSRGASLDYYIFGNNFRGPIKIWNVDPSENIKENEEFLSTSGEYAEFDNLTFTK